MQFTFKKSDRLLKKIDFDIVYKKGNKLVGKSVIINYKNFKLNKGSRLGLSVSKKVGNSPSRNRIKRLLREIYRKNKHRFIDNYDILIIAKYSIVGKTIYELEQDVLDIFTKAGLINK